MSTNNKEQKGITRREFVKGAAAGAVGGLVVGGGGAALLMPQKAAPAPGVPEKWDKEADVVVVGYGFAAIATAITAHDAGAKVLMLEKAPEGERGGNSRACGQYVFGMTPLDSAITFQTALNGDYTVPEDIVRVWAEEIGKNPDWIRSLGGDPVNVVTPTGTGPLGIEWPDAPEAEHTEGYMEKQISGYEALWKVVEPNVKKRGVEVLYKTPAKELVQSCEGEIVGVLAESGGRQIYVKAKKAVVLACGGFENNQEMVRDYLTSLPYCYPFGTPYNTGDGIRMAMAVGADLWHMENIAGPGPGFKRPDVDYVESTSWGDNNYIYVGADGTRYINEKIGGRHGKIFLHGQWVPTPTPVPIHIIFDETVRRAGPVCNTNQNMGWSSIVAKEYSWSKDNSAEVAKGWIIKADTINELAGKIKVDPAALAKTVNTYNGYCAAGNDLQWGRDPKSLKPIQTPPYYAMLITPRFTNTMGGPRKNAKAQIVRPDRTPIPRLYEAGELGSVYSFGYNGGGNVAECLGFGRIAGKNAAAEKPWG